MSYIDKRLLVDSLAVMPPMSLRVLPEHRPVDDPAVSTCGLCGGAGGWLRYVLKTDSNGGSRQVSQWEGCGNCGGSGEVAAGHENDPPV